MHNLRRLNFTSSVGTEIADLCTSDLMTIFQQAHEKSFWLSPKKFSPTIEILNESQNTESP